VVLDYKKLNGINVNSEMSWTIDRGATAHGFCLWFDSETGAGFSFSNSPASPEQNAYRQSFLPLPESVELTVGDRVKVGIRADFVQSEYVWSWKTRVTNSVGQVKAEYRQSTFNGMPLSPEQLRKGASSFVPAPNIDAAIDREILELFHTGITLEKISQHLVERFPEHFPKWHTALTRVAKMSARYSQ
jgi:hypothetical protein